MWLNSDQIVKIAKLIGCKNLGFGIYYVGPVGAVGR